MCDHFPSELNQIYWWWGLWIIQKNWYEKNARCHFLSKIKFIVCIEAGVMYWEWKFHLVEQWYFILVMRSKVLNHNSFFTYWPFHLISLQFMIQQYSSLHLQTFTNYGCKYGQIFRFCESCLTSFVIFPQDRKSD